MSVYDDDVLEIFEAHIGTALTRDDVALLDGVVAWARQLMVVDLKRHYDGEDGLVGPFSTREAAQTHIDDCDTYERQWAVIRPLYPPS